MSGLAAMLALSTGQPGELCEEFLKELFGIVGEELEKGENVRIKGLGTFKLVEVEPRKSVDISTGEDNEIPAHKRVVFVATKELAAMVNAPFEAFEAVEISDMLPTDDLQFIDEEEDAEITEVADTIEDADPIEEDADINDGDSKEPGDENPVISFMSDTAVRDTLENTEDVLPARHPVVDDLYPVIEEMDDSKTVDDTLLKGKSFPEKNEESDGNNRYEENDDNDDNDGVNDDEEDNNTKSYRFLWGCLTGFFTAIVVIALTIGVCIKFDILPERVGKLLSNVLPKESAYASVQASEDNETVKHSQTPNLLSDSEDVSEESGSETDSDALLTSQGDDIKEETVPTRPSDVPIYDTVSTTRYLTTMAKEHYGNFNLWPIIYEENKAILGHPDRIKPGTKVVVPPLQKYNIDPNNPEDIQRIKEKGASIYARYK